jgi:hypothetical protein
MPIPGRPDKSFACNKITLAGPAGSNVFLTKSRHENAEKAPNSRRDFFNQQLALKNFCPPSYSGPR